MRVTGGELAGRRLRVPRGGVRPSADRVREALFARLGPLEGLSVLDLYAGSGALGIEALSRGAERAVFVDRSRVSLACLERNLRELGLEGRARVVRADALAALARLAERFDLVLLDPPYESPATPRVLEALARSGLLAPGATLVLESSRRTLPQETAGLVVVDRRRYGDTVLTRLARASDSEEAQQAMPKEGGRRTIALFAASFDPLTNGHLDMLRAVLGREPGIRITSFEGLVVDYARELGATAIIRGLRAMSDFEYEFEMALMNKHLHPDLETLFMMTDQKYFYVSSSRLKELVRFGGDIEDFVPPVVAKMLREKAGLP